MAAVSIAFDGAAAAPFALLERGSLVRLHPEEPSALRGPLQRDRDRIIHSAAFRKLGYKTQVFMCCEGDYYRTRLSHSLEVAQVSRTLARHFRANEDLAEALALAHDLGHAPFGHAGEDALNSLMLPYGGFDHNAQALRVVTLLEKRYPHFDGLNLTWDVLEGLAKHNGPPLKRGETIEGLPYAMRTYALCQDLSWHAFASFEAQIVALSDDVAYSTHDLEDGLRAGFFTLEDLVDLPVLGPLVKEQISGTKRAYQKDWNHIYHVLRQFMGLLVQDVVRVTEENLRVLKPESPQDVRMADRPVVAWQLGEAQSVWRDFLFKNMYRHPGVLAVMLKAKRIIKDLFELFREHPTLLFEDRPEDRSGLDAIQVARLVCDHIASMTDQSVLKAHRQHFHMDQLR